MSATVMKVVRMVRKGGGTAVAGTVFRFSELRPPYLQLTWSAFGVTGEHLQRNPLLICNRYP